MQLSYISLVISLCAVIEVISERTHSGVCNGCLPLDGYTRIKRAKYFSSPPQRFYNRPPMAYPIRGPYSYTPPPGYMMDNEEQPPPNFRSKVSKRPTNEGLGHDDLNNIFKHLSKQDLDKLIEFANEKETEPSKYNKDLQLETLNYISSRPNGKYESRIVNRGIPTESDNEKFSLHGPYTNIHEDFKHSSVNYNDPNENDFEDSNDSSRYPNQEHSALFVNKNTIQSVSQFESEETMQNHQYALPSANTQAVNKNLNKGDAIIFTDSSIMQEEQLPKPTNLREDDQAVSYTSNVPTVVKPDSFSYKVENFGALPLMNYHSKLDTVDSYRVPHYTVTSFKKHSAPAPDSKAKIPPVEAAPPASTAQEQSDAHLKAIKIWTHRSKGTAYTLHDDGTLSLEKPRSQKTSHGFP